MSGEELWMPTQAAECLGVSRHQIHYLLRQGRLSPVGKINGYNVFRAADVVAYGKTLDPNRKKPGPKTKRKHKKQ